MISLGMWESMHIIHASPFPKSVPSMGAMELIADAGCRGHADIAHRVTTSGTSHQAHVSSVICANKTFTVCWQIWGVSHMPGVRKKRAAFHKRKSRVCLSCLSLCSRLSMLSMLAQWLSNFLIFLIFEPPYA